MTDETINAELLSTVHGGVELGTAAPGGLGPPHGGPSLPTDGRACTLQDPLGQRARHYFTNPSPGGHGSGHGSGHNPHLEMPIEPYRNDPWRPGINRVGPRIPGRSDRRLKRCIRSL